ncbi:MAG: ATP-binding protein [Elusimicrobia bacterium]|nr:ATP-binding protein [Elusimicrobiota bacterium]
MYQIDRIINQVALGKSQSIFLTGEYGIGKSSLARCMKVFAINKGENNDRTKTGIRND